MNEKPNYSKAELRKIAKEIARVNKIVAMAIMTIEDLNGIVERKNLTEEAMKIVASHLKKHYMEEGFAEPELYGSYFQEFDSMLRDFEKILDPSKKRSAYRE